MEHEALMKGKFLKVDSDSVLKSVNPEETINFGKSSNEM